MIFEKITDFPGAMIAGIIEHEHQSSFRVVFEQLTQELRELLRVFLGMNHVMDLPGAIIERSIGTQALIRSRSWHERTDTSQRPDLGQGRVEMNLTLIEVEQVESSLGASRPFLTNARKAFFSSYSWGSRR